MRLIEICAHIAREMHEGHVDKAGVDYFEGHIKAVVGGVEGELEKCVAYLHDVIEDCDIDRDGLYRLIVELGGHEPVVEVVVEAVHAISKRPEEKPDHRYYEYVDRVKANPLARAVKLSDYAHNLDLSRLGREPNEEDLARNAKYEAAVRYLHDV